MRIVPARHPAAVVASVFALFAAGPLLGSLVGRWAAPGSELAGIVSPMAFALAFVGGAAAWFWLGVAGVVGGALRDLVRGRWSRRRGPGPAEELVPPGCGAFVVVAVGLALAAGVIAGLAPQAVSFVRACAGHVAAGALYGVALRAAARHGYLPFPEPN